MLNPYQQKVHQKLAHVRITLGLLDECGDTLPDRQKRESLVEAAMLHLAVAYGLYLKELALNHNLPGTDRIHSLDQLEYELNAAGVTDAALIELLGSEQQGWLKEFLSDCAAVQHPAVATQQNSLAIPVSGGLQGGAPRIVEESAVKRYLVDFDQMVDRQRHANLEY